MAKKNAKSFEAAMEELEQILAAIADEATPLEESLRLYARAADLVAQCNEILADARVKVSEIDERLAETREAE